MKQTTTSAETSRPQIARGIKLAMKYAAPWAEVLLDFGAGKYNHGRDFVESMGHIYLAYDPYNRSEAENRYALAIAMKHCDIITVNNVLNVLDAPHIVHSVLAQIELIASSNTTVIFTVYEGDKTGKGKYTKCGFQMNWKLEQYIPYIEAHFENVGIHDNAIFATKKRE
jgi:hypothetical protein